MIFSVQMRINQYMNNRLTEEERDELLDDFIGFYQDLIYYLDMRYENRSGTRELR